MGISVLTIAAPAALTATTNGDAANVTDFHGVCKLVLSTTATGGAGQTSSVKIQQSEDGLTGWQDTGLLFETIDETGGATMEIVTNVDNYEQYLRAVTTLAGVDATVSNCVLLVGRKQYET